jgi:Carboxypeptidase regulatory-like domain
MGLAKLFPICFCLAVTLSWAQSQFATVNGTVTDASGSIVPGAVIRVVNLQTGENWSAISNDQGNYVFPLVKPGVYRLTAEQTGFKLSEQTGIELETGMQVRIDVKLEIGTVSDRVVVEAAAPLLQSESSAVGAVVENRTIINMPLIDRRAAQLARLNGFVVQVGTGSNFTMAGGRGDNSMWLIDGGNAQNVLLGVQTLTFDPPIESLHEFNVSISNYAAELGRTGGGIVQLTTKSGTNQLHGSAYEYLRNDALDARNFFAASKPKLRYNLFGASVGGPIRQDKMHYFFNYEGLRVKSEATRILNIPTSAEVRGDFSASAVVIRDPAAPGRPQFPGNIIPASRLDPIGMQLAAFYPEPNVPGRPSGSSNFRANQPTSNPADSWVGRIDHIFSQNDRLYGRLLARTSRNDEFPIFPTPGTDEFHRIRENSYYNASATWFHSFTARTINEFRFTWDRRKFINRTGGALSGLNGQLGLKGVDPDFFPRITITGFSGLGNTSNQERLQVPIRTNHYADSVSHIRGNHRLKAGFEWRSGLNDDQNRNRAGGDFTFNDVATGSSLVSLLLGWVQRGVRDEALLIRSRAGTAGAFIQDDWKVTPTLSLNLGLRWDLDQPRWESIDNRQNSFDRFALNPVSGTPGVVTFSGRNGLSQYAHNFDKNNFGPRLGFAWRVRDNWIIRGGGAVVFLGAYDQATPLVANLGFSIQGDFLSPDNGLTPAFLLRDGLPPISTPSEADLTPGFGAVPAGQSPNVAVEFFDPARANGYMETFNLNIQHQITQNFLVEIGYLGTLGHKLPAPGSLTLNQVPNELMGPGNTQVRRPFPQFSDVTVLAPAVGNSNYHGMNLRVEKRHSQGLYFQANYTWSRLIDDVESRNELGGSAGNGYSNSYDRRSDRGLAGNHVSHRFIWSSIYELPFGAGKRFAPGNRILNGVVGGWSFGLIAEFRTGPPYGVIEQVNRTNAFSPSQRPNLVSDPALPGDRSRAEQVEQWFNTGAFVQPAQFTFGNAGRTVGYGPGAVIMDLSILKDYPIREAHRLQLRCEMLNFINRANFGLPNLNRGSAAFGRITTLIAGNEARIIQLGLHYKF